MLETVAFMSLLGLSSIAGLFLTLYAIRLAFSLPVRRAPLIPSERAQLSAAREDLLAEVVSFAEEGRDADAVWASISKIDARLAVLDRKDAEQRAQREAEAATADVLGHVPLWTHEARPAHPPKSERARAERARAASEEKVPQNA